jgi:hypothetical protein
MLSILLSLCAATSVSLGLADSADSGRLDLPIRVEEVRDLRVLGRTDPRLVGVTELGVFEERSALRTERPLAEEVLSVSRNWIRSDSQALPVRLEILSMETWPVSATGPDPIHVRTRIRIVSRDTTRPGTLLTPQVEAENKGFQSAAEQIGLLRGSLRDALSMVKPGMKPVPEADPVPSAPDTSADPARIPAKDSVPNSIHHAIWGAAIPSFQTFSMSVRYSQYASPQAGWVREYWGALQVRGPWGNDKFDDVWSGEVGLGQAWFRRMDDGRSPGALVGSLGGLIGLESFRRVRDSGTLSSRRTYPFYLGVEARGGFRWIEDEWTGEAGIQLALREPTAIAAFDPGIYAQFGWNF